MLIEYVSGDLLDGEEVMIIHGCNAQGVMGRGVALAIKERLPFAYYAYRRAHLAAVIDKEKLDSHPNLLKRLISNSSEDNGPGSLQLGQVIWGINIRTGERPRIVGNAITQQHWRSDKGVAGRNVNYDAVRTCFQTINEYVLMTRGVDPIIDIANVGPITRVGLPFIGAGLGGGDWDTIAKIIEEESKDFVPVVYQLKMSR